jgi:DNA polymerase III delta subunit
MVLFLYGPDSLLRLRRTKELLTAYLEKNAGADRLRLDLAEDPENWKKAVTFLHQPSMFAEKKFLWVDSATEPEGVAWRKLLKEFLLDEKVFILLTEDREPRKDFKFLLESPAKAEVFPELTGVGLKNFVLREIKKLELKITPDILKNILYRIEGPGASWRVVSLLNQLVALDEINLETIKALTEVETQAVPVSTAKFASSGPLTAGRLEALEHGILSGDPAYLFNSLTFRLRGKELLMLADLDADIKLGGLEYEEALLKIALG